MRTRSGQKSVRNSSSFACPPRINRALLVASNAIHSVDPFSRSRKRRLCIFPRPARKSKSRAPSLIGASLLMVHTPSRWNTSKDRSELGRYRPYLETAQAVLRNKDDFSGRPALHDRLQRFGAACEGIAGGDEGLDRALGKERKQRADVGRIGLRLAPGEFAPEHADDGAALEQ